MSFRKRISMLLHCRADKCSLIPARLSLLRTKQNWQGSWDTRWHTCTCSIRQSRPVSHRLQACSPDLLPPYLAEPLEVKEEEWWGNLGKWAFKWGLRGLR